MVEDHASREISGDLIVALESARIQLSIAIAAKRKSTPPARWRQYLDTADRMRRFMRELRKNKGELAVSVRKKGQVWEALQQIEGEQDALRLCQIFEDMVSDLE